MLARLVEVCVDRMWSRELPVVAVVLGVRVPSSHFLIFAEPVEDSVSSGEGGSSVSIALAAAARLLMADGIARQCAI